MTDQPETLPRCCDYWPECSHSLSLWERYKRGEQMSDADMRRLERTESELVARGWGKR